MVERWQSRIFEKPKIRHFDIFPKSGCNDFFGFWPEVSTKYHLQFEWQQFFRKYCILEIFDFEIVKKIAQIEVFGHFLDFASLVFLDFAHNDRWTWCLVVFLQFAGPVNAFLFPDEMFFYWKGYPPYLPLPTCAWCRL